MKNLINFFCTLSLADISSGINILAAFFKLISWIWKRSGKTKEKRDYDNTTNSIYTKENLMKRQSHTKTD